MPGWMTIEEIQKFSVVALAMQGVSIGRKGKLSWLQIQAGGHVFLFDVLRMGKACFDGGLTSILENEEILKVLHDCRMVSDMLHHKYGVDLVNVFDTQVANVFVYRLRNHYDWPRYTESLAACLIKHLGLSNEEVTWAVVRHNCKEADEEVWLERPPRPALIDIAVKNVKHLLELRSILMEKMLEEYVAGVNIFLMHVRDASDGDAERYLGMSHLLPMAFQNLRCFMNSYTRPDRIAHPSEKNKDMYGFRENCSGILQPNVYYSKDSLWHAGSRKKDLQEKHTRENKPPSDTTGKPSTSSLPATPSVPSANFAIENSSVSQPPSLTRNYPEKKSDLLRSQSSSSIETADIPSRRSLLARPDDDLVKQTVQAMNSGKLSNLPMNCIDESVAPSYSHDIYNRSPEQLLDAQDGPELSGGGLMRALIYEQDPKGFESHVDITEFEVRPAGTNVNVRSNRKKNSQSTDYQGLAFQNPVAPLSENVEAKPKSVLVSPHKHFRSPTQMPCLTDQEIQLLRQREEIQELGKQSYRVGQGREMPVDPPQGREYQPQSAQGRPPTGLTREIVQHSAGRGRLQDTLSTKRAQDMPHQQQSALYPHSNNFSQETYMESQASSANSSGLYLRNKHSFGESQSQHDVQGDKTDQLVFEPQSRPRGRRSLNVLMGSLGRGLRRSTAGDSDSDDGAARRLAMIEMLRQNNM
ncbi:uncharacterized protein LOC128228032 isoform X2 [Mya arenaria]|uniref:uncharacterized protein LOC128228032 isoform X2 n=1 Tax=Mya arenaria TaxID=6604 RepID=UPI0022E6BC2F|nr:uncharacterized protein LOC128228032 isoform X2 [Mya arenaria]